MVFILSKCEFTFLGQLLPNVSSFFIYPIVTNVGYMLRSGVDQTSAAHLWADIYRKGEEAPMININITAKIFILKKKIIIIKTK